VLDSLAVALRQNRDEHCIEALPGSPIVRNMNDRPLTVLDITKWYGERSGGVRTYLDEKQRYVTGRSDLRHVLVIPGERDEVADDGNTRRYRIRGPRIPSQRQYRFLLAPRTLRRIVEQERPDIIEVGSPIFVPWIARIATRGRRIPLVGFYHTDIRASLAPLLGPLAGTVSNSYVRLLDRLFATTFVASDTSEADLRLAGARRVTRVGLGVDLDTFHPRLRASRTRTRAILGLPLETPIVTYVGRIAPEKALDVALAAWRLVERRTHATLVVMGDGPLRAELQSRSARMDVRWLPFETNRQRVAQLLAASDVYLSPGPSETFGLAAVEAMACGTPIVSPDRGSVAEHARKSKAGLMFAAGQARSLADQLLSAIAGALESSGAQARAYVEQHHSWRGSFDQIFATYDRLARQ
jgi:alpha-1,6-mannosyltransferase